MIKIPLLTAASNLATKDSTENKSVDVVLYETIYRHTHYVSASFNQLFSTSSGGLFCLCIYTPLV